MRKIVENTLPILMILVWLMPVSNQYNTLNDGMMRRCYLSSLLILIFVFLYEKKIYVKQFIISILLISILLISTVLFYTFNKDISVISYGYLMNYLPFCMLININPKKVSGGKILDVLFISVCFLLIFVGILTVLNNSFIEQLLKTNYIIHYPYIYDVMWASHKTVTFFGTHSIACYLYYILWWLVDYRRQIKPGILNYVLIVGILFNIVMCSSVSAVLCVGLIFSYYYLAWIKSAKKIAIIRSMLLIIVFLVAVFINIDTIFFILGSSENGLLGRYGESGNLNATLRFTLSNLVPLGICDVRGLWLTDGGYFVHFIRGGIIFLLLFYYGLYRFLKMNISVNKRVNFLFLSFLLFEVGYQFTTCMRFFMIMLFAIYYFKYLESYNTIHNKLSVCSEDKVK